MILSFIIPYYKGKPYIKKLLESIVISYETSSKKIVPEIILVLDSQDGTEEWLQMLCYELFNNMNIRFSIIQNNENLGVDKSRDIGIENSTGDLITCIDQDDYISINYISELENNYNSTVNFYFINGYLINIITKKQVPIYYHMPKLTAEKIIRNNCILSPSFLILNRHFVIDNKLHFSLPFDEYKGVDDWYFTIQLLTLKVEPKHIVINKKMIYYCLHNNNYSKNILEIVKGSIKVLESISVLNKRLRKSIALKLLNLNFSINLYSRNKILVAILEPFRFLSFIKLYFEDYNRIIRFVHKNIIQINS